MQKKPYEVKVTVHEQVNRSCLVTVKVEAYSPGAAAYSAQGDAEQKVKEGAPEIKWSEPSYHYTSEPHQTNEL